MRAQRQEPGKSCDYTSQERHKLSEIDFLWPIIQEFMHQEITIIGGSIAGLILGVKLCNAKIPVEINEAGTFPRHRVCPEIITAEGLALLNKIVDIGPITVGPGIRKVTWFFKDRPILTKRLWKPCRAISRYLLDQKLGQLFEEKDGNLRINEGVAGTFARERQIIAYRDHDHESAWSALKGYAYGMHKSNRCDMEVHLGHNAYGLVIPVDKHCFNILVIFKATDQSKGELHEMLISELEHRNMHSLQKRLELSWLEPATFCLSRGLVFQPMEKDPEMMNIGKLSPLIPPIVSNAITAQVKHALACLPHLIDYTEGKKSWQETVKFSNQEIAQKHYNLFLMSRRFPDGLVNPTRQPAFIEHLTRSRLWPIRWL